MQGTKVKQVLLEIAGSSAENRKPHERGDNKGRC